MPSQNQTRHALLAKEAARRLLNTIPGAQDVYVGVLYTGRDGTDQHSFAQGLVSREPGSLGQPPRRMLQALVQATLKMMGVDSADVFGQAAEAGETSPTTDTP